MDLIEIPAADGAAEAHVSRPDGGSGPGVLLVMDVLGVRPRIADMCDRIASWGYTVMAPNVFYREGGVDKIGPHADLREPAAREEFVAQAMPRLRRLTTDLVAPDLDAYVAALRRLPLVDEGPLGVTGYCMGAGLALRTATQQPDHVAAVGGFHGAALVTDQPDSPHLALPRARAEFVFGHADQDSANPASAIATLGEALAAAGLRASNEVYPGAPHGYTMADTSAYQEAGTERHFAELEALFARRLPIGGAEFRPGGSGGSR